MASLANASAAAVETVLQNAAPFESGKQGEGETEREAERRKASRCFWLTGRQGLTFAQAAEAILEEARGLAEADLGLAGDGRQVQWGSGVVQQQQQKPQKRSGAKKGRKKKAGSGGPARRMSTRLSTSKQLRAAYSKKPPEPRSENTNLVLKSMLPAAGAAATAELGPSKRRSADRMLVESLPKVARRSSETVCSTPLVPPGRKEQAGNLSGGVFRKFMNH